MKRFLITIGLTCVLAASTVGGEIPSVPLQPPPPDDGAQTTGTNAPEEILTAGYTVQMSNAGLSFIQLMVGVIV
jgi:hypothetical protein